MYITPANWYAVFNLRTGLTEWNCLGESKQCEMMKMLIKANSCNYPYKLNAEYAKNIIIAREPEIATKIIANTDYERTQRHHQKNKKYSYSKKRLLFQLDNTYSSTHFILLDQTGIEMLRILAIPNYRQILVNESIPKKYRFDRYSATGADGMDEQRNFYFIFFDSNIKRLRQFRDGMDIKPDTTGKMHRSLFPLAKKYCSSMSWPRCKNHHLQNGRNRKYTGHQTNIERNKHG